MVDAWIAFALGVALGLLAPVLWRAGSKPRALDTTTPALDLAQASRRRSAGGGPELPQAAVDALYIWSLRTQNRIATRAECMRRGEMSAHRWNRAQRLLAHLRLSVNRHSYSDGYNAILAEVQRQQRHEQYKNWVAPH
jgi:hypothetical protein